MFCNEIKLVSFLILITVTSCVTPYTVTRSSILVDSKSHNIWGLFQIFNISNTCVENIYNDYTPYSLESENIQRAHLFVPAMQTRARERIRDILLIADEGEMYRQLQKICSKDSYEIDFTKPNGASIEGYWINLEDRKIVSSVPYRQELPNGYYLIRDGRGANAFVCIRADTILLSHF